MKEQYSFREISNLIGSSTDKGAEKAYHTALDRFTAQLAEDNVIRVVDIKLEKVTRRKKKIATATYGIRQTATANGARFNSILKNGKKKFCALRTGIHLVQSFMQRK